VKVQTYIFLFGIVPAVVFSAQWDWLLWLAAVAGQQSTAMKKNQNQSSAGYGQGRT
jgi:hypothetical protein